MGSGVRQENFPAGGTSFDPSGTGIGGGGGGGTIPPLSQWFFVDKNAPAGGDGSIAKPFNTIADAVAAAEVAAKTYVGPTGGLGAGVCVTGGGFFGEDLAWSDAVIYLWANLPTAINSITITRTGDLPCGVCLDGAMGWTEGLNAWTVGTSGGNISFRRTAATSDPADAVCFLRNVTFSDDNDRSVEILLGGENLEWDSGNGEIILGTENVQARAFWFREAAGDPTLSPAIWRYGIRTRSDTVGGSPTFLQSIEHLRDCAITGGGGLSVGDFDILTPNTGIGQLNTIGLPLGLYNTVLGGFTVDRGTAGALATPVVIDSVTAAHQTANGGSWAADFSVSTIG